MPVGTVQFGQADLFKTETHIEAPITQLGRAAASGSIADHGRTEVGTAQFGQANLSKTETHAEAPMTQRGRAAAPGSIIDHVWFVRNLSELEA